MPGAPGRVCVAGLICVDSGSGQVNGPRAGGERETEREALAAWINQQNVRVQRWWNTEPLRENLQLSFHSNATIPVRRKGDIDFNLGRLL